MFTCGPALLGGSSIVGVTWNPSDKGANATLSNGNLTYVGTTTSPLARATTSHSSTGKYYFEVHVDAVSTHYPYIGLCTASVAYSTVLGTTASSGWSWQVDNTAVWHNGTSLGSGANFTTNDVVGVAVDFAASKIWWSKNNVWILSGNPGAGTNATFTDIAGTLFPAIFAIGSGGGTARFASASFTYTAPSGFGPW